MFSILLAKPVFFTEFIVQCTHIRLVGQVRPMFDLTHILDSSIPVYPGDPKFSAEPIATVPKDGYHVSHLSLGTHSGTHLDAPSHFIEGATTVHQLDLSLLVGPATVVDVSFKNAHESITWDDISHQLSQKESELLSRSGRKPTILLLYTGWSRFWRSPQYFDHPFLDGDAAERVIEAGYRVVGIDGMSLDQTKLDGSEVSFAAHYAVLGAGGIIVENLTSLETIKDKDVIVSLLPLNIREGDGSPIRAVAWVDQNK
ncbi:arylformamidase [Sistotremastrum suecicum HHB10207 ss-3]|uniref:Arylformamidase n=1 Tax=Sistotremastrum suecicum HHB10207 ss-3 TaxID=1314776 RepID=A0A166GRB1_9AGAM|nr:arylformamidase [Sistotremastrum suecicum HHB10207 ss-3]